jgi:hypothetical protein
MIDQGNKTQHSAILLSCTENGIIVYDQWEGNPLARRLIPWYAANRAFSGDSFWGIAAEDE